MLTAEIIAIGSELLTPDRSDTNSLWLTEKLNSIGIEVMLKTIVGDDELRLEETIRDALKRSDIVITTGGLGPTEDDVTRKVSARAVGREMIFRQDLADHLEKRFERLGHKMPEINLRQAYVIDGCEVLPNPNGSAVGMYLEPDAKSFAMFPGPPREMQPMFSEHVFPKLRARAGQIFVRRKVLRVSGMGESAIDQAIAPIYTEYTSVQTSILFNRSEVEVHLSAKGENESEAGQLLSKLADKIAEKLGIAVFAMNGEIMEEVVGNLLSDNGKTLAVAESCTGGLISQRLTDIPGSSQYFIEGAVTYANEAKIRALGVPAGLFAEHGAVSAEVAEAMAVGIREKADTDFGISVTGIAGPDGGTEEKPVGLVFIGYSGADGSKAYRFVFPGDRYLIRWRSSQAALDILRRKLLKTNG